MYDSSWVRSTRHCPRPPILIAGSSPLRTSAYVCDAEMFRISATSPRVRNRSRSLAGMAPLAVGSGGSQHSVSFTGPGEPELSTAPRVAHTRLRCVWHYLHVRQPDIGAHTL